MSRDNQSENFMLMSYISCRISFAPFKDICQHVDTRRLMIHTRLIGLHVSRHGHTAHSTESLKKKMTGQDLFVHSNVSSCLSTFSRAPQHAVIVRGVDLLPLDSRMQ